MTGEVAGQNEECRDSVGVWEGRGGQVTPGWAGARGSGSWISILAQQARADTPLFRVQFSLCKVRMLNLVTPKGRLAGAAPGV